MDGNVNAGKAAIKTKDSLFIKLRANGQLHIERSFGEDYKITLSGDAVSFKLNEHESLALGDKRFENWPLWQQILFPGLSLFTIPTMVIPFWWRKLRSLKTKHEGESQ